MKKYFSFSISYIISIFLLMLIGGCDKEDNERIVIMTVSSELVWTGTNPPTEYKVQVMECAIDGSDEILLIDLGHIEGFDYEEGYEYKLKVSMSSRKNPPADGPTMQYKLIELISKEKKR